MKGVNGKFMLRTGDKTAQFIVSRGASFCEDCTSVLETRKGVFWHKKPLYEADDGAYSPAYAARYPVATKTLNE